MKQRDINSLSSLQAYRRHLKRESEDIESIAEKNLQSFLSPLQRFESYVDDEILDEENSVLDKISNVIDMVNTGICVLKWGGAVLKTFKKRSEQTCN